MRATPMTTRPTRRGFGRHGSSFGAVSVGHRTGSGRRCWVIDIRDRAACLRDGDPVSWMSVPGTLLRLAASGDPVSPYTARGWRKRIAANADPICGSDDRRGLGSPPTCWPVQIRAARSGAAVPPPAWVGRAGRASSSASDATAEHPWPRSAGSSGTSVRSGRKVSGYFAWTLRVSPIVGASGRLAQASTAAAHRTVQPCTDADHVAHRLVTRCRAGMTSRDSMSG